MRTHDLLRLKSADAVALHAAPDWVAESLSRAPFVVVRRSEICHDAIPVGIRGETREQRFAAVLALEAVAQIISPEQLAQHAAWRAHPRRSLPAFAALEVVAEAASQIDLIWGPAGSAGFELASKIPIVRPDSDLDIVVRPTTAHTHDVLEYFRQRLNAARAKIDVLIETKIGGVVLDEWLHSPRRVLIKTIHGPQLSAFAW